MSSGEPARDLRPVARGSGAPVLVAGGAGGRAVDVLAERISPVVLARDQRLPVPSPLAPLLPQGALRRGTTVAIGAAPGVTGATSLALALAAGASRNGSWVAAVGLPSLGLVAADELGVALERLVLVAGPDRRPDRRPGAERGRAGRGRGEGRSVPGWPSVVAALVDGFDVVLAAVGRGTRLRPADVRRLVARVRERGSVLVAVGGDLPGERSAVRLVVTGSSWHGLGRGWGHLQRRRVTVEADGRGESARPRRAELWLPGPTGEVVPVGPVAEPVPLHRPPDRRPAGTGAP